MTRPEALSNLMIVAPALWSAVHLAASRWAEIKSDRLRAAGAPADQVEMATRRARMLQDFSRLMPNWMPAVLLVGLVWRGALLLIAVL